jgi:hypothetical protein
MPRKHNAAFLKKAFFKAGNTISLQQAGINWMGYTPNDIESATISEGDYPYIGFLSGYYSTIFNNAEKRLRVSSTLLAGTMGKYSYAEDAQKIIHRVIKYKLPKGWNSQLTRPLLINYDLLVETAIFRKTKFIQLVPNAAIRLGMINSSIAAGATVQVGLRTGYFSYYKTYAPEQPFSKKLKIYFTWQPKFTYVAYNGLLEPALKKTIETFNENYKKDNAYPVVKRYLFDHAASIYLHFKNWRLGFTQSFYAKELNTTKRQEVGGLHIAFKL